MAYIGKAPFGNAVRTRFFYTASGSETSLSGADSNGKTLSFTDGNYVDVYLNGVLLITGTDYNTSTENTIAGLSALSAGDNVEIVVYETFSVFNSTFTGGLTVSDGNFTLSNGSVGIGTTSPLHKLYIDSGATNVAAGLKSSDAGSYIGFEDNTTGNTGTNSNVFIGANGNNFVAFTGATERFRIDSSGNVNIYGPNNRPLAITSFDTVSSGAGWDLDATSINGVATISTGGSERMRIDSSGNVGIGTTSPDGTLHVKDTIAQIYIQSNDGQPSQIVFGDASDASRGRINYDSSDNIIFENNNLTERMRITSSGNVGIGTTSPVATLQIKTQTNGNAAFQNSTSVSGGVKINAFNDAANASVPFELDGSTLQFNIAAAEKMRLDSSGNLGLGVTSPLAKFDVIGSANTNAVQIKGSSTTGQSYGGIVLAGTNSSDAAFRVYNQAGSISYMFVRGDGNVGIGTTSPASKLHIFDGGSSVNNTITFGNPSATPAAEIHHTAGGSEFLNISCKGTTTGFGNIVFKTGPTPDERMRITASGNVGIGHTSPDSLLHISEDAASTSTHVYTKLHIEDASHSAIQFSGSTNGEQWIWFADDTSSTPVGGITYNHNNTNINFRVEGSERMRIMGTGQVLVGMSSSSGTANGLRVIPSDFLGFTTNATDADDRLVLLNRQASEGTYIEFRQANTNMGAIRLVGTNDVAMYSAASSHVGIRLGEGYYLPINNAGSLVDNAVDIGLAAWRYNDAFITNGVTTGSDQNEKQQIASLTNAEIAAAKRISNGFKTFKWNDAVAAKGDNARTHTGVIAQEVRTALEAEGLDAGDYAFFMSDTWWEANGEFYKTFEEAPEGATERTRLGIRYPELLAFVGAANEQRLVNIETRLTALEAN